MAAKKTNTKTVTKAIVLKQLCGELKIEPKAARRKLRAADLSFHGKRERWVIPANQVAKVREVLSA